MSPARRPPGRGGTPRPDRERELDGLLLRLVEDLAAERGGPGVAEAPTVHYARQATPDLAPPAPVAIRGVAPEPEAARELATGPHEPLDAGPHLDDATLDGLRAGTLPGLRARRARRHLAGCLACLWAGAARWSRAPAVSPPEEAVAADAASPIDQLAGAGEEGLETALEALQGQLASLIARLRKEAHGRVGSDDRWRRELVLFRRAGPRAGVDPGERGPSDPGAWRARAAARRRALATLRREATRRARALDEAGELEARSQALLAAAEAAGRAELGARWERPLAARWAELLALLALPPAIGDEPR